LEMPRLPIDTTTLGTVANGKQRNQTAGKDKVF